MSDLTRYEEHEGRQNSVTNAYFRFDFISKHMLGSFFSYTFCSIFVFIMIVIYRTEDLLDSNDLLETVKSFRPYLMYYLIGLAVFELITILVYNHRYNHAARSLRMENAKLRRLEKRMEIDEKSRKLGGE